MPDLDRVIADIDAAVRSSQFAAAAALCRKVLSGDLAPSDRTRIDRPCGIAACQSRDRKLARTILGRTSAAITNQLRAVCAHAGLDLGGAVEPAEPPPGPGPGLPPPPPDKLAPAGS